MFISVSFGGDTKSRRSLLSGVYVRGSKRSHQSALEMCNLSWTPHSSLEKDNSVNHSCVSPKMGRLEYTNKLRSRQRRGTREIIALFILRMVCRQSCLVLFALKLRLLTSKLEVGSQLHNRVHISRASCLKNPGERK